ncbi:hypothetical protein [Pseudonocardia sp. HH130630-07]|uniref:hypothetical protein n=1 Tax=Pseudonocardia sp. HH130630-07 TaxID=1690815 RepID=UPI0008152764|nr:hypothetical protein [Pseudonocardia sp. HH130630-07]ANY05241.1 hypothetical protein AFB00_01715 [Pseudonocardia sp. HH130630-07]
MGRRAQADEAPAERLDLTEVSAARLRDRLDARADGRDDHVVRAAVELRASLDRFRAGVALRRAALVDRAGEMARSAAPFAGGAVAAVAAALVARKAVRRTAS